MAREMKNSGVSWIDKIPKSWDTVNLRHVFSFGKGLPITKDNLKETGISVISYGQIHSKANNGISISSELARFVDESYLTSNPESLVKQNDFIVADTSEDLAGCGNAVFVDTSALLFAGYHTIILKNNKSFYNKYFAFLFQSDAWRKQIRERVTGVKLFSISQKILRSTTILLPPIDEQKKIADYLEHECALIDDIIAQTRSSIEEYKRLKQAVITQTVTKGIRPERPMKETGNNWIPTIPTEWQLTRVGLHFDITLGKMLCTNKLSDDYTLEPYYCAANVHFDGVTNDGLKQMWFSSSEKKQYLVSVGDLLVVEGGAGAGGCAVVKEMQQSAYIQNSIMIVRPRKNSNNRYLGYLLESLVKSGYIDVACNKATIPHFTKDKLANVPFPISSEQEEIADYLDAQLKNVDVLISKKESLLTELDRYKKTLIFEYVTGKKEVPA